MGSTQIHCCFYNSVDLDQPLNKIYTVFISACKYMLITFILQANWIKLGEKCSMIKVKLKSFVISSRFAAKKFLSTSFQAITAWCSPFKANFIITRIWI